MSSGHTPQACDRGDFGIGESDRRQEAFVFRLIRANADAARRNASRCQHRLNLTHRIRHRTRIGRARRYVDMDGAGAFVQPGRRHAHHIGALGGGQPAAGVADEDDDRAVLLLDRDRVTLLVVVGNRGGDLVMLTTAERDGDTDERATDGASANLGWSCGHNEVPVPPQSVMKP